jgi:hypothetical protein
LPGHPHQSVPILKADHWNGSRFDLVILKLTGLVCLIHIAVSGGTRQTVFSLERCGYISFLKTHIQQFFGVLLVGFLYFCGPLHASTLSTLRM